MSSTPPMTSKVFWKSFNISRFFSHPTAQAPRRIGTARPSAKASNRVTPNSSEPIPATTPSMITRAGVQKGHTATENGIPKTKAPQRLKAGRDLIGIAGIGKRSLSHPGHSNPRRINNGPKTKPHLRPKSFCTQSPPKLAISPSSTWVTIIPRMNRPPKTTALRVSWALVTIGERNGYGGERHWVEAEYKTG